MKRFALVACVFVATAGASLAQEPSSAKSKTKPKEDAVQMGSGVILKVEPIRKEGESEDKAPSRCKITINTAAVWADYARDTADFSAKPNAKKGENSVATKGEPVLESALIVAEVEPSTHLALRYRSSTDESDKGSRTIEKAEKKDGSPESNQAGKDGEKTRAPKIHMADIKPGLFVEIEAKKGKANRLIVLKPVGGPQTPASEDRPEKK